MKLICRGKYGERHTYRLSTGKRFKANYPVGEMSLAKDRKKFFDHFSTSKFTPAEIVEIADYMIDLWNKHREQQFSLLSEEEQDANPPAFIPADKGLIPLMEGFAAASRRIMKQKETGL